ncbi:MAG: lysylphosphatidylglycerol synthase transmembrane domain-containing protein [Candidatus Omnitrophica bacterium]|nr:lysylphosphatidylglycerol synthase transmembrane domain-containing protein [Candidatus Omnitrophota bacterium]
MKNICFFILRLITAGLLLYFLFAKVPYQKIVDLYSDADKLYLVSGLFIFFMSFVLGIFRWQFLLAAQGVSVGYFHAAKIYLVGLFFNLFCPSFVAGDIFRAVSFSSRYGSSEKIASSVLMDRFSGACALTFITLVAYGWGYKLIAAKEVALAIIILCAILIGGSLLFFSRRFFFLITFFINKKKPFFLKVKRYHDQFYFFRKNPAVFFKSFIISIVIQLVAPVAFYVSSKAFYLQVDMLYFLVLVPIIMVIAIIPVTIAGLGLRENAAVFFFSLIGINAHLSAGLSLISGLSIIISGIVGGGIYVGLSNRCFQSCS